MLALCSAVASTTLPLASRGASTDSHLNRYYLDDDRTVKLDFSHTTFVSHFITSNLLFNFTYCLYFFFHDWSAIFLFRCNNDAPAACFFSFVIRLWDHLKATLVSMQLWLPLKTVFQWTIRLPRWWMHRVHLARSVCLGTFCPKDRPSLMRMLSMHIMEHN